MSRVIYFKIALAFLFAMGISISASEAAKRKVKTGGTLNCTADTCKTDIKEYHHDDVGAGEVSIVFHPPAGIKLDDRAKGGIEIEGGGATHYVNAVSGGVSFLECKWHAATRPHGDNGFTKGYCWISVLK